MLIEIDSISPGAKMPDVETFLHTQSPTAIRPLLGLTILLVEDSLTACEAMRLMCLRSGARIRRADCLESGRRHLRVYRPNIVIADLGLPDGSGIDLIRDLATATPRVETIIGLSADPLLAEDVKKAGADGFIEKPIGSIAEFQAAILGCMPEERRPNGPRRLCEAPVEADPVAVHEDLALAKHLLQDGDQTADTKSYLATFLSGVARTAQDAELQSVAASFAKAKEMAGPEKESLINALSKRLHDRAAV